MTTKSVIGLVLIAFLSITACTQQPTITEPKETVKIGVTAPLSGDLAFLGDGLRHAIELADDTISDTNYRYEFIFEDDSLDPKLATNAANKLIHVDNVDAIISYSSTTGNAISQVTKENEVIHMGIASDGVVAEGPYNYIHWTTPDEEGRIFVTELLKRNLTKVATIQMQQQGAQAITQGFKDHAEDTDIELVYEGIFTAGTKDFQTILSRIQQENPEIIFIVAISPELELIGKQIKELGITTPLTSIEAFEYTEQPELFEGQWYIQAAEPKGFFNEAYTAKFLTEPTSGAANAYDIVNMLISAIEKAESLQAQDIKKELDTIKDFPGALGPLTVGSDGIVQSQAIVKEIRNGEFVSK